MQLSIFDILENEELNSQKAFSIRVGRCTN
jgi:hypothetical protein